jgi:hypothetical protein
MDGITAVTARIGEIRALLHPASVQNASPPSRAAGVLPSDVAAGSPAAPTFSDVLTRAVAPTGVDPPSVAELRTRYSNGRLPTDALASAGDGGHRLAAPAAAAFWDLQAAARRDGVTVGVTDSYRSFDAQVDVARRKGLYSNGGLAAQPGTSQHGWGLAVDLDLDSRAQAWMRTNAARFGFVEDTPREPWHWAYKA